MPSATYVLLRSPARDEVMRRMYPTLADVDDIAAALNELPGLEATRERVARYAEILSLRRPAEYFRKIGKKSHSPTPTLPVGYVLEDAEADLETVLAWATDNRVEPRTLSAVNERRRALGLPGFRIRRRAAA